MNEKMLLALRRLGFTLSFGGRSHLASSMLRRTFRHSKAKVRIDDFDGELSMELSLSDHMQRRIFWMGYYSREIVALLDKFLREGMTVIDVGANVGEIALASARRVGKRGQVHAFEPLSAVADILQSHARSNNLGQITLHRMGLSDRSARVPIFESCGQGIQGDDHAGLGSIYGSSVHQQAIEEIEITTLDKLVESAELNRIDLIKIDIEGAELPCLLGSRRTLQKYQPLIIIEVQQESANVAGYEAHDILRFLHGIGYETYRIGWKGKLDILTIADLAKYQNVLAVPPPWRHKLKALHQ